MKSALAAADPARMPPGARSRRAPPAAGKYANTSLAKCFEILEVLGSSRAPQSLAAVRAATGLNKTTGFRLLQVLKDMGYVVRTGEGYALGYRLYRLTLNMSGSAALRRLAHPFLVALSRAVGETVHLGILEQTTVIYIDTVEVERGLRIRAELGQRVDAHATALGKALLAGEPAGLGTLYGDGALHGYTGRTVTDLAQLQRLLKQVRVQGFAVDNEELELGLRCVAAPVGGDGERPACAVSISGPTVRITDTAFPGLVAELRRCTQAIEASFANGDGGPAGE